MTNKAVVAFVGSLMFLTGLIVGSEMTYNPYGIEPDELCQEPISCSFHDDGGLTIKSSDDGSSYYLSPEVFGS